MLLLTELEVYTSNICSDIQGVWTCHIVHMCKKVQSVPHLLRPRKSMNFDDFVEKYQRSIKEMVSGFIPRKTFILYALINRARGLYEQYLF